MEINGIIILKEKRDSLSKEIIAKEEFIANSEDLENKIETNIISR